MKTVSFFGVVLPLLSSVGLWATFSRLDSMTDSLYLPMLQQDSQKLKEDTPNFSKALRECEAYFVSKSNTLVEQLVSLIKLSLFDAMARYPDDSFDGQGLTLYLNEQAQKEAKGVLEAWHTKLYDMMLLYQSLTKDQPGDKVLFTDDIDDAHDQPSGKKPLTDNTTHPLGKGFVDLTRIITKAHKNGFVYLTLLAIQAIVNSPRDLLFESLTVEEIKACPVELVNFKTRPLLFNARLVGLKTKTCIYLKTKTYLYKSELGNFQMALPDLRSAFSNFDAKISSYCAPILNPNSNEAILKKPLPSFKTQLSEFKETLLLFKTALFEFKEALLHFLDTILLDDTIAVLDLINRPQTLENFCREMTNEILKSATLISVSRAPDVSNQPRFLNVYQDLLALWPDLDQIQNGRVIKEAVAHSLPPIPLKQISQPEQKSVTTVRANLVFLDYFTCEADSSDWSLSSEDF